MIVLDQNQDGTVLVRLLVQRFVEMENEEVLSLVMMDYQTMKDVQMIVFQS